MTTNNEESFNEKEQTLQETTTNDNNEKIKVDDKKPPDGGWGWMVVLGSALAHFLLVGLGRSFGVFIVELMEMYGKSAFETCLIASLFNTMRMVFGPITGMLCDRFTCQKVVIVGTLIITLGCVISTFSTSVIFLYFSFGIVAGIGSSLIFTPSYIIVGHYFDKKKGFAMSMSTLGSGIGTLAMAPIITALLDRYMFCGSILVIGGMQLNNLVAGALFRPLNKYKKKAPQQKICKGEQLLLDKQQPTDTPTNKSKCRGFGNFLGHQTSILKNFTFLLYGFQIFAMSICIQTFLTFLPSLADEHGLSKGKAAIVLSVVGLADMVGRFIFGFLFDLKFVRFRRRLFHAYLGIPVGLVCIIMGFINSFPIFICIGFLYGLVEGGFHSQRATIVSEFVSKDKISSTVGFVIFFQGLGNLAGPPVAGALRDSLHTYSVCYYFSGSCLIVTSLIFLLDYLIISKIKVNKEETSNKENEAKV